MLQQQGQLLVIKTPCYVKRQARLVYLKINFPNETALGCFLLPGGRIGEKMHLDHWYVEN